MRLGQAADSAAERAWFVPVNVGSFDELGMLLGAVVGVVVIAVIVIPLLLFGIELMIVGLVVAGGIVARSALGRPWIVQATPIATRADPLAWEVKGWRHSEQLIEQVATELAAGLTPEPSRPFPANPPEEDDNLHLSG